MHIPTEFHDLSHRNQIGPWLNARGLTAEGVEVGVLFGGYSQEVLKDWNGILHCVDPWIQQPQSVYFDSANLRDLESDFTQVRNTIGQHPRCRLHRMFSLEAANLFADGQLDWVYLDGNHALDSVRADIAAWWPKVRPGGVFSGHDCNTRYDFETNSDAGTAVLEFSEKMGIRPHLTWCTSWWFMKR